MKIFGYHSVHEALRSNKNVVQIWVMKEKRSFRINQLLSMARKKKIKIQYVNRQALQRLSGRSSLQKIVALLSPIKYQKLESLVQQVHKKKKLQALVFLVGLSNVGNVASIARSAECLGISGIIVSDKGTPQVQGEMIKLSSGALLRLPIYRSKSLLQTLSFLREKKIKLIGTFPQARTSLFEISLQKMAHCWLIGNERNGLPAEVRKYLDYEVCIPQLGELNSLNASNAASICFYESLRQNLFPTQ